MRFAKEFTAFSILLSLFILNGCEMPSDGGDRELAFREKYAQAIERLKANWHHPILGTKWGEEIEFQGPKARARFRIEMLKYKIERTKRAFSTGTLLPSHRSRERKGSKWVEGPTERDELNNQREQLASLKRRLPNVPTFHEHLKEFGSVEVITTIIKNMERSIAESSVDPSTRTFIKQDGEWVRGGLSFEEKLRALKKRQQFLSMHGSAQSVNPKPNNIRCCWQLIGDTHMESEESLDFWMKVSTTDSRLGAQVAYWHESQIYYQAVDGNIYDGPTLEDNSSGYVDKLISQGFYPCLFSFAYAYSEHEGRAIETSVEPYLDRDFSNYATDCTL